MPFVCLGLFNLVYVFGFIGFNIQSRLRIALQMIAKKQEVKNWDKYTKLADVQRALKYDLGEMLKVVMDQFHDGLYTKEEVGYSHSHVQ